MHLTPLWPVSASHRLLSWLTVLPNSSGMRLPGVGPSAAFADCGRGQLAAPAAGGAMHALQQPCILMHHHAVGAAGPRSGRCSHSYWQQRQLHGLQLMASKQQTSKLQRLVYHTATQPRGRAATLAAVARAQQPSASDSASSSSSSEYPQAPTQLQLGSAAMRLLFGPTAATTSDPAPEIIQVGIDAVRAQAAREQVFAEMEPVPYTGLPPTPPPPFEGQPSLPPNGWKPADVDPDAAKQRRQQLQQRSQAWVAAARNRLMLTQPYPAKQGQYIGEPDEHGVRETLKLDTSLVADAVFSQATLAEGVTLFEPFGGLCAGLEMCLRNGMRIQRYIYCDKDRAAQAVARHRVHQLAATYPDLFDPQAAQGMFSAVPQDITKIDAGVLVAAGALDGSQWLVVAGWECQDLSMAGRCLGLEGPKSRTFYDLVRVVGALQQLQPARAPAFILENAPMQHNYNPNGGDRIREGTFPLICDMIGEPIIFDAAQFGAYAARLRNYWTNLGDAALVQCVVEGVQRPPGRLVDHILDPGRWAGPGYSPTYKAYYPCNQDGQPMQALPTLVAYLGDRGYNGKPLVKHIRDERLSSDFYTEANAYERERALGYATGATAAPGISKEERHAITGRCMDAHAMESLMAICWALQRSGRTSG